MTLVIGFGVGFCLAAAFVCWAAVRSNYGRDV